MRQTLDIANWKRKQHYAFFKEFDEPFFGIVADLNCSAALKKTKEINTSFFLFYLHKCILAANQVEEFKYRIEEDKVYCYDEIGVSATIGREDETFGFSHIPFHSDYKKFEELALEEIRLVKESQDLFHVHTPQNVIHFSAIPWMKFTSVSHARKFNGLDSVPKISIGKVAMVNNEQVMPVSVHVHHALMDGLHVSRFFNIFQNYLDGDGYI